MKSTLKLTEWNGNGLLHHEELQAILDTEKIMCLVSETYFSKQCYTKFKGYKLYNTIHPKNSARGGSAVIIKENIHHREETKYEREGIQSTAVCIKARDHSILIAGIYFPRKHPLKKYEYLDFLGQFWNRFIVGAILMPKAPTWVLG